MRRYAFVALTGLGVVVAISVGGLLLRSSLSSPSFWGTFLRKGSIANDGAREHTAPSAAAAVPSNQVRIAAGMTSGSHVDAWGHRWESDRYYRGGASQPGPKDLFPPPPDPGLVSTMRESVPPDPSQPASQGSFSYDIPVPSGVYELRLYFADPAKRSTGLDIREGGEDLRHFTVNLNGRPLLSDFDSIADGGFASVDVRAFKDVVPAADGKVHIEFVSGYLQRSFVNALELTPGTPGKLMPIRLCAHRSSFTDASGTLWSGDNFFINGRLLSSRTPTSEPGFPALYSEERYGNFSYAIPVPPGSYTVKLHFAETFFPMSSQAMLCHGSGCRVFDVTCNGVALLSDFDVLQTAGGAFRPVVRTFHGLRPNGQGKLLLSFSPSVNYAEVRAIEVIDEAQ